jgi:hypothetical protein
MPNFPYPHLMKYFCTAFFLLLCVSSAEANTLSEQKNLTGRLGLGFTSQMATTTLGNLPALSAKYFIRKNFATSLQLGFDSRSPNSAVGLGVKAFRNVFLESNTIFYIGAGGAFVSNQGTKLQGSLFLGAEFFFSQVPSLGFSFEAGVRGDNSTGSFTIRTIGDNFLSAGTHFYF